MNQSRTSRAAPRLHACRLMLAILLQAGAMLAAPTGWAQPLPTSAAQADPAMSAALPELTKGVVDVVGSENGTVTISAGAYQLVVTVLNSRLRTATEREVEAARIAGALSKAIAAKPEFRRLQAYHIDYVTNSGDRDDAHFVDGIDFRKNPDGKFIHHKS